MLCFVGIHGYLFFPGEINECYYIDGSWARSETKTGADECKSIEVTGGTSKITSGIYTKTLEYPKSLLEGPVWKHQKNNRYIFNTKSQNGWKIGVREHFNNGKFYYASKMFFKNPEQ